MHDLATLLVELGGVIFGIGVLARVARALRFSPIPLYLLAGLAVGTGGALPLATSDEFIATGAEIGVILLLLLLGLEYSADELLGNLRSNAPSGVLDCVLGAGPGVAAAFLLGWGPVAAIAMGGVTWVSSSGIVAKLLTDLDRIGNRETPVVLSVLVFEDLSMAVYLPILTALLAGLGWVAGGGAILVAVGTVMVVLVVALRFGHVLSRLVSAPNDETTLLLVFGLALLVAGIAQQLQVSSAVGAFLLGIALSGEVAENARALLSPLRDLFAAVFFVFFGLRTDPAEIPPVLLVAAAIAAVTIVTKMATGWWAARRAGIAIPGRARAGSVLVARGEFSIVIAGLAASAGIQPGLQPLAAAYVLLMAAVGPPIARLAEPAVRAVLRRLGRLPGPQPVPAAGHEREPPSPVPEPDRRTDGGSPRSE